MRHCYRAVSILVSCSYRHPVYFDCIICTLPLRVESCTTGDALPSCTRLGRPSDSAANSCGQSGRRHSMRECPEVSASMPELNPAGTCRTRPPFCVRASSDCPTQPPSGRRRVMPPFWLSSLTSPLLRDIEMPPLLVCALILPSTSLTAMPPLTACSSIVFTKLPLRLMAMPPFCERPLTAPVSRVSARPPLCTDASTLRSCGPTIKNWTTHEARPLAVKLSGSRARILPPSVEIVNWLSRACAVASSSAAAIL